MSLTLYETASFKTLEYCLELRSLKLIGGTEWIEWIIKNILQRNTKLCQLTVITPVIRSLSEILTPILSNCSLRRIEIRTEEMAESIEVCTLPRLTSNIEQFVLDSSSTIDWNELTYVLSPLDRIDYLSISVINRIQNFVPLLFLPKVRTLNIGLLEVSFDSVVQLVATMPCIVKLKITGLVDADGFVVNQKWIHLFETAPTLLRIAVYLSLEQTNICYHCEKIQMSLCALNLSLACDADETDCYSYYGNINRWWRLSGIITKPKI